MLNPGDRCPCCGNIIPAGISAYNLTLLRLLYLDRQRQQGIISGGTYLIERDKIIAQMEA